jgi:Tfp pilus assembly protein PilF
MLLAQNQLGAAVGHFEDAVKRAPADAVSHFNLANALAAQGKQPDALAQYADAVRLQPDAPEARLNYGIALAQSRRLTDAAWESGVQVAAARVAETSPMQRRTSHPNGNPLGCPHVTARFPSGVSRFPDT